MNKLVSFRTSVAFLALSAVAGYSLAGIHAASAETVTKVERSVTVYDLKTDAPDFYGKLKAICSDDKVKLSDKAKTACKAEEFPKLTKAKVFRNAGIGAEFNTLANQR